MSSVSRVLAESLQRMRSGSQPTKRSLLARLADAERPCSFKGLSWSLTDGSAQELLPWRSRMRRRGLGDDAESGMLLSRAEVSVMMQAAWSFLFLQSLRSSSCIGEFEESQDAPFFFFFVTCIRGQPTEEDDDDGDKTSQLSLASITYAAFDIPGLEFKQSLTQQRASPQAIAGARWKN